MSEVRVVDLKELGVNKEVFDKIYSMGEQDGRADAIEEYVDNCIELVKGLITTYDSFESFDNVGVNIVLDELNTLVKDLEHIKEQKQ